LHKALIKYPAGTGSRWDKIAEFIVSRSPQECQRKCAELKNNFAADAAGMTVDPKLEFERTKAEAAKGHGARSGTGKKVSGTSVNTVREEGRDAAAALEATKLETDAATADPKEWSLEQQSALEAAMAEFKGADLDPKERFKKIAERVPGKTDKECIKRVKEIKALLQQK